jgi:hypothetical protein
MLRRSVLPLALLCASLFAAPTLAADLSKAQVKSLVQQAKTMVATENVVQGIAIYEQIYDGTKDPKYLYNIGYLYEDTGQLDMAWDFYQRFLLAWPDAPNGKKLQNYLGELKTKLEVDYVLVHVFTTPPGAAITVVTSENERRPSGVTPMSTWMPFGEVTLKVSLKGHEAFEKTITVKPRKSQRLRMNLKEIAKATDLRVGPIGPGTALAIDGETQAGLSAGQTIPMSPGAHTLTLTLADGTQRTHQLTVDGDTLAPSPPADFWTPRSAAGAANGQVSGTSADLSASSSASPGLSDVPLGVWITGSVAVATASVAAVLMAIAHGSADEARGYMGTLNDEVAANNGPASDVAWRQWSDADATASAQQTASIALFVAASAAAATSVIWWFVDTPSGGVDAPHQADLSPIKAGLSPIILHDGLGAQATWRF